MKKLITLLFILFPAISFAGLMPKDSSDLVDLYYKTNGKNWKNFEGWFSDDLDSWYGVKFFHGDKDLVLGLDLKDNRLSGRFPAFAFPLIQKIDLSLNELTGQVPRISSNYLRYLDLSKNGNEKNPGLSGKLGDIYAPELEYLDLSFNEFNGTIPDLALNDIKYLDLSHNKFSGDGPNLDMPELIYLNLSHNLMRGRSPRIVSKNLKTLDLSNNSFAWVNELHTPNLTKLDISDNYLRFSEIEKLLNYDTVKYQGQRYEYKIDKISYNEFNIYYIESISSNNIFNWVINDKVESSKKRVQFLTAENQVECTVSNSNVNDLELNSRIINVNAKDVKVIPGTKNGSVSIEFNDFPEPYLEFRLYDLNNKDLISVINLESSGKFMNLSYPSLKKGKYLMHIKNANENFIGVFDIN